MGEWTKSFIAVLVLLGGTFFLISLTTADLRICTTAQPDDRWYLGFSCDAWLQSIAQVFGGGATLAAVLLSLKYDDWKRSEDTQLRLGALADEFAAMTQHLGAVESHLSILRTMLRTLSPPPVLPVIYHHMEVTAAAAGNFEMVTYDAVVTEVARMTPDRSKLITSATLEARSIPGVFKAIWARQAAKSHADVDVELDHLCRLCRDRRDAFSKAATALRDHLRR